MEHDFSKVFDTDNPMWQEVLAIFTTNEQHPKKPTIGRAIHHKFPRSISKALGERVDGSKANLISLTHKDHFMIHYYYFKLALPSYRGAMASAFRFMVNKGDVKINDMETKLAKEISDTYQVAMTEFSKRHSALMKGKKKSKEHCQHISEGRKGIVFSEEHKQHLKEASHRRVLTPEQRDRMRTGLGKHPKFSEEHMRKWHEARHNTPTSEETRRKMSESAKRRYQLHPMSDEERQRRSERQKGRYRVTQKPQYEIWKPILDKYNHNEFDAETACKELHMSYKTFKRIFAADIDPHRRKRPTHKK